MRLTTVSDDLARLRGGEPGRTWERGPDRGSLVILFTPRSGSTWLGKLLEETGVLGFPEEYLNPDYIQDANSDIMAASEHDFLCGCVASRITENGFFSIEVPWGEIERFETVDFFEFFSSAKYVWLRRYDVVDQAISLLLATETGIFQRRPDDCAEELVDRSSKILKSIAPTDMGQKLIQWIAHIVRQEAMTEIEIAARSLAPYRLFYEDLERSPAFHVAEIKQLCGVADENRRKVDAVLKNVQSGRDEFRNAFIKNHRGTLKALEAIRPPLVY